MTKKNQLQNKQTNKKNPIIRHSISIFNKNLLISEYLMSVFSFPTDVTQEFSKLPKI